MRSTLSFGPPIPLFFSEKLVISCSEKKGEDHVIFRKKLRDPISREISCMLERKNRIMISRYYDRQSFRHPQDLDCRFTPYAKFVLTQYEAKKLAPPERPIRRDDLLGGGSPGGGSSSTLHSGNTTTLHPLQKYAQ